MAQFGAQLHAKPKRKITGNGKTKKKGRDKKRHEMGGYFIATKLATGEKNVSKAVRGRGGTVRKKLKHVAFANLLTENGYKKARIKSIVESKDNRNFARLNIITKGTLIDTEFGKAVVTNRAGRDGSVNAKLVK